MLWAGGSLLGTVGIVAGLILMVKHEPTFYRRAEVPAGKERNDLARVFVGRFADLVGNWVDVMKGGWEVTFTEKQINSYFEEDFIRNGDGELFRRQGITNPRIILEKDVLRLAFRYGKPPWSTIISYDFKMWLAPKEANVVCLEIVGRHAGALPMSSQSLLNEISNAADRHGIQVTWYRHQGNPVALIRFPTDQSRPSAQLRRLDIMQGLITIGGFSQDPYTKVTPNLLAPSAN
jgi:hypothetical protein